MADITRRGFLKLAAGAGAAMAADFGTKSFDKLIPYVQPPDDTRPSVPVAFATTCRECPAGCGMYAMHLDGRVIKVEGNPDHPINHGRLCPRGQSAVQGLYDPDRLQRIVNRRVPSAPYDWPSAIQQVAAVLAGASGRVAVISDLQTGLIADVLRDFAQAFGSKRVLMFEPFNYEPLREAHATLYGRPIVPRYNLAECRYVISFGADFLESWVSNVEFTEQFARMRELADGKEPGHFAYVGPRLTQTAANADVFLQVEPGAERAVALAMLNHILDHDLGTNRNTADTVRGLAKQFMGRVGPLPPDIAKRIPEIAERFAKSGSLALAGPAGAMGSDAYETCLLACLLNELCGRAAVDLFKPHALSRTATRAQTEQFLAALTAQDVVVIHRANIAYAIPSAAEAIKRCGTVVYLGTEDSETSRLAHWVLPTHSPLESWGDYAPYDGRNLLCFQQPAMSPVFPTQQAGDVLVSLAAAAGRPLPLTRDLPTPPQTQPFETGAEWALPRDNVQSPFYEALRKKYADMGDFDELLRRGYAASGEQEDRSQIQMKADPALGLSQTKTADAGSVALWPFAAVGLFDGRTANRGWIQELPEPISYVVWNNVAEIHPKRALSLGLHNNDVVELASPSGKIELAVRITEDIHENAVAVMFGQGHTALGPTASRDGRPRGGNAFALLGEPGSSAFAHVTIRPIGRQESVVYAMGHGDADQLPDSQRQHGRELLQWVPLTKAADPEYMRDDNFGMPLPKGYVAGRDVNPPHPYTKHRWAMVLDLHKCVGCGACTTACYSENNVPVVGETQVRKGRLMSWLRIIPYRHPEQSGVVGFLPMLCQQCDSAPCEPVCPVFAAVHNEEGLNAQIYNRCIGTRYCSNNCPYKVRRFNWFDHDWPHPTNLLLNPDVTVRVRGVMEKCNFCVQRIRRAEMIAKREGRPIRDGEIAPACVQTCPAGVFTFGDLLDENSAVSRLMRNSPRRYQLLSELSTKPGIAYLRRIEMGEGAKP